jgi:formate hydrogenlyase subunit 3/multisubunit Na+/H+ antiporter MnhD subunit
MKRAARIAVLALIAALAVGIGGRVLLAIGSLADQPCHADDSFPGWLIVVAGLTAFGVGGLLGRYRDASADLDRADPSTVAVDSRQRAVRNAVAIHLVITLFLLSVVLILAYETVGLRNPWGLKPITSYVRCAKTVDPWTTMLVAAAVSLLTGHWLWPPTRRVR